MLSAILTTIREGGKPMCLSDLSAELNIDQPALEGMLDTLVARGRLRTLEFTDDACSACPVKGGCFIMNDGVAVTYALRADPATSERSLPASS